MVRTVDLFVFDLAGTVVMDDRQVLRAFQTTCAAFAVEAPEARLRERMGWHKQRVFEQVLVEAGRPVAPAAAMAERFVAEYARSVAERPLRPTPGALEVIAALQAAGIAVAFNTGFARATADLVLHAIGFGALPSVASDEVAAGRPAPDLIRRAMQLCGVTDPKRVGVAGDTPADLLAGAAAGVAVVVGVGCGTHTLAELADCPHSHLVPDLRALPAILGIARAEGEA